MDVQVHTDEEIDARAILDELHARREKNRKDKNKHKERFRRLWNDIEDRIKVDKITQCHEWQGAKTQHGYGVVSRSYSGKAKTYYVHRLAYEVFVDVIPPKYEINHLCKNPACCNPKHLQALHQLVHRRTNRARKSKISAFVLKFLRKYRPLDGNIEFYTDLGNVLGLDNEYLYVTALKCRQPIPKWIISSTETSAGSN